MTEQDLLEVVRTLQQRRSELDDVEVKSAQGGTPKELWQELSAFANRPGGGLIVFGLDPLHYRPCGIGDLDQLQRDVAAMAAQMEPPLAIQYALAFVEGQAVLGVEVPEVPSAFRPCYYKPRGMHGGAFVRVGDSSRLMTEYEIYLFLSARAQPAEDRAPVDGATLRDLDEGAIDAFLRRVSDRRPTLAALGLSRREMLQMLNVLAEDGIRPTLAGLLLFGQYPQHFYPNLVIAVTVYGGDSPEPVTRFDADVRCEGPLPRMVDAAMVALSRFLKRRVVVSGLLHEEIPEYPSRALRELLANAVVHRDYSRYAIGTQVQVRLHPTRIEIQNPGGLFGPLSVEQLGEYGLQAARNPVIATLSEDLGLMENRGTGIAVVLREMRRAHLSPPVWKDGRTYFRVVLSNANLLDEETLQWLSRFSGVMLDDGQRYALAYLRRHRRMANRDYQNLNGVDASTARRALQELVRTGLVRTVGIRGGTMYELTEAAASAVGTVDSPAQLNTRAVVVRELLEREGPLTSGQVADHLGWSKRTVLDALRELMVAGLVAPTNPNLHARNRAYRAVVPRENRGKP